MSKAQTKSSLKKRSIKNILILRWGGIGDFLLTLPAILTVRKNFPEAHLAIMGNADTISLAKSPEYADDLLQFNWSMFTGRMRVKEAARLGMIQKLQEFDLIINFHSFALLDELLVDSGVHYLSFEDQVFFKARIHASTHFNDFVRAIAAVPVFSRPKLFLSSEERRFARKFLNDYGFNLKHDGLIAVHVGSGDPRKRWFLERFRELIQGLLADNVKILLLSGPADGDLDRLLYEGAWRDKVLMVRHLAIRHVAALIERTTLFVGNDSGLMHLAAAVGIPTVALFGPSDPVTWGPLGPQHVIVKGSCLKIDLDAGGCRACDFPACLDSIPTAEVIRVVRERLKFLRSFIPVTCWGHHLPFRLK